MAIINTWLLTPSPWSLQQCFEAYCPPTVAAGLRRGEILPTCLQLIEELCFILWLSILLVPTKYWPEDLNRTKVRGLRRPLKKRYSWENSPDALILFLSVFYEICPKPNEWRNSSPVPLRSLLTDCSINRSCSGVVLRFLPVLFFLSSTPMSRYFFTIRLIFCSFDNLSFVDSTLELIPKLLAVMVFAHSTSVYVFPLFLLACSWGARAISTSDWALQHTTNTQKSSKDVNETPCRRTSMNHPVEGLSVTSCGTQRILLWFHDQVVVVMGELSIHFEFLNFCDSPERWPTSMEPAVDPLFAPVRTFIVLAHTPHGALLHLTVCDCDSTVWII